MTENQTYEEIRSICIEMTRYANGRLIIVKGEADETTDFVPDADEFLKLDGKRCGRDFKLYDFLAKVSSVGEALADFAYVLKAVENKIPQAFEPIRTKILNWDRFFDQEMQQAWRDLWKV